MVLSLFFLLLLSVFLPCRAGGIPCSGTWKTVPAESAACLHEDSVSARAAFPGNVQIRVEPDRRTFRPERRCFDCGVLTFRVRTEGFTKPLKAWIFVTDKDGTWFQSEKEYALPPSGETILSIRTDHPGREFLPSGHHASWSSLFSAVVFSAGVSICSDDTQRGTITVFRPERSGTREEVPLAFRELVMPSSGEVFEQKRVRFGLTREFFNPFDPSEIAVDLEVREPDSPEIRRYPAFFSCECERSRHFTKETVKIAGEPYWEFRFVPKKTGKYFLRLAARDRNGTIRTEWTPFHAKPGRRKGFVKVSPRNPFYFEFDNGEFFYPVGLNAHCSTDPRCERVFRIGFQPDCGIADYERFFPAFRKAGINLSELWMASWSCAIEWNSAQTGFYGLGRYNLVSAWVLDRILDLASANGILINLVLDNHGKLSDGVDPEWDDSPFNKENPFAAANGAILSDADSFWKSSDAIRYNEQRNRYIGARWGADPNIFAFEFWSEVDLTGMRRKSRDKDAIASWHRNAAVHLRKQIQGNTLLSTHVCSDIRTAVAWHKVTMDLPELPHIASDAYRSDRVPIADQMELHRKELGNIRKPAIVTEYGGSTGASGKWNLIADLHGGMWISLFTRQAGIPMLWWHELVHHMDLYPHYRGFRRFMTGVDLRDPSIRSGTLTVQERIPEWQREIRYSPAYFLPRSLKKTFGKDGHKGRCLLSPSGEGIGWIWNERKMYYYPSLPMEKQTQAGHLFCTVSPLKPGGSVLILFYDTISGNPVSVRCVRAGKDGRAVFSLPPLRLDTAFKLLTGGTR